MDETSQALGVPTYMASHYVYGAPLVDPLNIQR